MRGACRGERKDVDGYGCGRSVVNGRIARGEYHCECLGNALGNNGPSRWIVRKHTRYIGRRVQLGGPESGSSNDVSGIRPRDGGGRLALDNDLGGGLRRCLLRFLIANK